MTGKNLIEPAKGLVFMNFFPVIKKNSGKKKNYCRPFSVKHPNKTMEFQMTPVENAHKILPRNVWTISLN